MFCKKCGAELRLNAKFCAKCGTPAKVPPVKSTEEVKTVMTREDPAKKVINVPPTEPAPKPVTEASKLVIHMAETKPSSSNGQFNEWFSEPGDLD